jgi:hypothetical protein
VRDTTKGLIDPFANSFLITWISDYKILDNNVVIWKLTNQKERATTTKK